MAGDFIAHQIVVQFGTEANVMNDHSVAGRASFAGDDGDVIFGKNRFGDMIGDEVTWFVVFWIFAHW